MIQQDCPGDLSLVFAVNVPQLGTFTTMSQLMSPRSHILSTRFTSGISCRSPVKEHILYIKSILKSTKLAYIPVLKDEVLRHALHNIMELS